jgi:hypothetical protein
VSYLISYKGENVIYKQFKSHFTSDGRIETEIAHAAMLKKKGLSKRIMIMINDLFLAMFVGGKNNKNSAG